MAKENDLFLNSILNPNFTAYDFKSIGLNTGNTSISSDMDSYKDNKLVKEVFTKPDGSFDDETFKLRYQYSQYLYNGLDNAGLKDAIETTTFHRDNIFVSDKQRSKGPDFNISFLPNPLESKESVNVLGKLSTPALSIDERAQRNKVLANPVEVENGADPIWHDAPNDSFFSDFFDTRVLAQWDFDADINGKKTNDPDKIVYHKGEYKVNEDGDFYYENLDGRDIYGRRVLNKFNTLTTDGSYWNKFDFFDSDDMQQKSVGGTLLKNIAFVGPMFIPYVGPWIAVASAAVQGAGLLATLGKMLTDSDSPTLSGVEGWVESVSTQNLKSEYAQQNMWCWENYIDLVGDVVAQIRQQRALFKNAPSIFKGKWGTSEENLEKLQAEYAKKYNVKFDDFVKKVQSGEKKFDTNELTDILKEQKLNVERIQSEMDSYIKGYNKIGSVLSKSYMVGITVGDTYGEAKAQGASDSEATWLTIGYGAAEAALLNTGIGEWLFPELRVQKLHQKALAKALTQVKKETNEIESSIKTSINKADGETKKVYAKRLFNIGKNTCRDLYTGNLNMTQSLASNAFANALGEGVEEVSEEVLEDFSKGCFNAVSWLRGDDTVLDTNWWNKKEGVTLGKALSDYAMNFFGGLVGGAIGGINTEIINSIKNSENITSDKAMKELIHMVRNGEDEKFLKNINKSIIGRTDLSINVDSETGIPKAYDESDSNDMNQDTAAKKILKQQVDAIRYLLNSNGINISDSSILKQYQEFLPDIKESTLQGLAAPGKLLNDFRTVTERILYLSSQIKSLQGSSVNASSDSQERKEKMESEEKEDEKSTEKQQTIERYRNDLKEAIKERDSILKGDRFISSIERTLAELSIGQNFIAPNFIRWAEIHKKMKFDQINSEELPGLQEKYNEWKETQKGFLTNDITDLILSLARKATDSFKQHSDNYSKIKKNPKIASLEQYLYYRFSDILNKKILENGGDYTNGSDFMEQIKKEVLPENLLRDFVQYIGGIRTDRNNREWEQVNEDYGFTKLTDGIATEEEKKLGRELLEQIETAEILNNAADLTLAKRNFNDFANRFILNHIEEIISQYRNTPENSGFGFMNHVVRNGLIEILSDAQSKMDISDSNRSTINQYIKEIEELPQTPIEDAFDQFVLATTGQNLKLSELLNKLKSIFNGVSGSDLSMFNYNDYGDSVDNAINLLDLFINIIDGLRVDNGDVNNVYGFSRSINQIREQIKNSKDKEKYIETEKVDPYLELDGDLANLYTQDAKQLKSKLEFYRNLFYAASGQTIQAQTKIADKLDLIIYKRIQKLSINIPDDWNGKSDLINAIEKATSLKNYQGKYNTITPDKRKELRKEMLDVETALYEFFQKNASKLEDVEAVKNFILGDKNSTEEGKFDLFTNPTKLVNENSEEIDDNAFLWWIVTRAAVDPRVFYKSYYELIKELKDTDNPIAPIYTQRMAEYTNFAHIANGKIFTTFVNALKLAIKEKWTNLSIEDRKNIVDNKFKMTWEDDWFTNDFNDYILTLLPCIKYTNTIFVEGAAGTGKSAAVSRVTFALIQKYLPNLLNGKKILIGHGIKIDIKKSPTKNENERAIEFAKSLGLNPDDDNIVCLAGDNLIKELIGENNYKSYEANNDGSFKIPQEALGFNENKELEFKDISKIRKDLNYGIIVIDEIQNFRSIDLDILDHYASTYNISNIACGHKWQTGVKGDFEIKEDPFKPKEGQSFTQTLEFHRLNAIRNIPLGFSMRATCSEKRANNIAFEEYMQIEDENKDLNKESFDTTNPIALKYHIDENGLHGDIVLDRKESISEDGTISDDTKKALESVFDHLEEGEKVGFITDTINSKLYEYLNSNYGDKIEVFLGNSANGLEGKYYILDISPYTLEGTDDILKENRKADVNSETPIRTSFNEELYTAFTRGKEGTIIFLPQEFIQDKIDPTSGDDGKSINVSISPKIIRNFVNSDLEIYDEILKDVNIPEIKSTETTSVKNTTTETSSGKTPSGSDEKSEASSGKKGSVIDDECITISQQIAQNGNVIYIGNDGPFELIDVRKSTKNDQIYINCKDPITKKRKSVIVGVTPYSLTPPESVTETNTISKVQNSDNGNEVSEGEEKERKKVEKLNQDSHKVRIPIGGKRGHSNQNITYVKGYTEVSNETGLNESEWNGDDPKPLLNENDPRIDSIHGLYKLQRLIQDNPEITTKANYIEVLGKIHSAMNNSSYKTLNDLNKKIAFILYEFINDTDFKVNISFNFEGRIPGNENKGKYGIFNQSKSEYNTSGELVDVQRKKISMEVTIEKDGKQYKALTVPFIGLANPLTVMTEFSNVDTYEHPKLVQCILTVASNYGIDITKKLPEILQNIEELEKNGSINNKEFFEALRTEVEKLPEYSRFSSYISLYLITNNQEIPLPKNWCPADLEISTPTSVFGERNFNYINSDLRNKQISYVELQEIANNPALQVSSIMYLGTSYFQFGDGEILEHNYDPGHPFVLISGDVTLNDNRSIVEYFRNQERDPKNYPPKVLLVYVLPPKLSITDYVNRLHLLRTTNKDTLKSLNLPYIEDTFTTCSILYKLFCGNNSNNYIEQFKSDKIKFNKKDAFIKAISILVDRLYTKPDLDNDERSKENRDEYNQKLYNPIPDEILKIVVDNSTGDTIGSILTCAGVCEISKIKQKTAGQVLRGILESLVYTREKSAGKITDENYELNIDSLNLIEDFLNNEKFEIYYRVKRDSSISPDYEFFTITKDKGIILNNTYYPFMIHGDIQTTSGILKLQTLIDIYDKAIKEKTYRRNINKFINDETSESETSKSKKKLSIQEKKRSIEFQNAIDELLNDNIDIEIEDSDTPETIVKKLRNKGYLGCWFNKLNRFTRIHVKYYNSKLTNDPITIIYNGSELPFDNDIISDPNLVEIYQNGKKVLQGVIDKYGKATFMKIDEKPIISEVVTQEDINNLCDKIIYLFWDKYHNELDINKRNKLLSGIEMLNKIFKGKTLNSIPIDTVLSIANKFEIEQEAIDAVNKLKDIIDSKENKDLCSTGVITISALPF